MIASMSAVRTLRGYVRGSGTFPYAYGSTFGQANLPAWIRLTRVIPYPQILSLLLE